MRWFPLVTCFWTALAVAQDTSDHPTPPSGASDAQLVLELSDGSRIIGAASIDRLRMANEYANLDIPLALLSTIELSGSNQIAQADFRNGDLLSGRLSASEITVKTIFGNAVIPIDQIRRIHVGSTGHSLPDGLVLHYTFALNEGQRVSDMSGSGNDGKVQGATFTSEGKGGGAMSFNGDRQAVVIGNPASLQLQDFTIMAWIKRGDPNKTSARDGDDAGIIGYGHAGYLLGMFPDGRLFLSKVDVDNVGSNVQIRDNTFHHIVVTKNGNTVVFYVDGIADPANNYDPGFEFTTDAAVGARGDTFEHCFLGVIDQVAIFKRALSADEIKGIYDSQK
jgi:hypothetical protein